MSEDCRNRMMAISSTAAGPSLMPKTFTATNCGSDPESVTNNSISDKPAIQIKMIPPSDSKASSSTCKDVIVVNGVDMKTIVLNREKAVDDNEDKKDSSKLTPDSKVETMKEKTKDVAAKLNKESRSTCEFSSDEEVMDTSVLQVIDEVGCSSPECLPVDAEDATKQGYVEKVSKLTQPQNADTTQNADDEKDQQLTSNSEAVCVKRVEKDETDSNEKAENVKEKAEEVKEKTEDHDDYISLLKKRLTCTESEADELVGPSSSKKFKLDDPDDGQHVTVEVDPPFLTYQSDNEQDGKPCRKITKGELQKLVEKLVLEQVSASDRSQLEGLKLKFEQLERCSEKWRRKAFTLQKQITEQQIVIQRQNLTKKPPYILKPQMRSVGLQVDLNRNQGNSAASSRQPQVALLPKAAVTIRPIGPTVSTSPTKHMQGTCVSSNSSNGISVSILQSRARGPPPVLRPLSSPLPIPNVTVTPSSPYQSPANSRNATVSNKNAKVAPGVTEAPSGTSTQPVPTRLIPNQSVARQTSTNVPVAKSPSTTTVPGPTVVKFIDLSNDDDSAVTVPPAIKAVTMANVAPCPPNVSVVSSSTGNTISINANTSGDGRSLTIMTPPSIAAVGAARRMMNLAPMPRSAVAVPISPANLPLRLSTAQVTRPVSQQILHSTNIPNGARVAYLVPTSVALVRPPLNGTIVTQPIQRFAQPATIIRTPITAQAVLFERRVAAPNVSGVVTTATDVARCTTAPTTIMKSIVAGSPAPSIVTPLNTYSKANTPLIRRLQDECEKGKLQHPAPLPSPHYTCDATKSIPAAPSLKVSKELNGIVLSWDMPKGVAYTDVNCYQLYAYQESTLPASTSLWKKVGDVKALPLPMACTLTQFLEGHKYHFSVRAVDNNGRIGRFSIPGSIMLSTKRSSQTSK